MPFRSDDHAPTGVYVPADPLARFAEIHAALDSEPLHILEHASFLVTAVLFWHVVIGVRGAARVSGGLGVLLVFAMAMQSVFLSVLLTFARTPWYSGYATTTAS